MVFVQRLLKKRGKATEYKSLLFFQLTTGKYSSSFKPSSVGIKWGQIKWGQTPLSETPLSADALAFR
jgi:hypothetical protein